MRPEILHFYPAPPDHADAISLGASPLSSMGLQQIFSENYEKRITREVHLNTDFCSPALEMHLIGEA